MKVRPVFLEAEDAVELGELLDFLGNWLANDDSVGAALDRFVGGGYDVEELRGDLERFAVLVGGIEEPAFGDGR